MCSDIAIKVRNLSKCFHIYDKPRDRLKQMLLPRAQHMLGRGGKKYFREFWALNDISFDIQKGETVGIIGRNGSGKSTLLQLLCGTLVPTAGEVETTGRVAALLELGSGFNPEFTGRENVYMNGSLLGLSKNEVDAKFDDIAGFADIGQFIDQPVKTYSSGMVVRLAFAVQSQIDPDILIVDEALSVGDAKFQAKCFERLKQLKNSGTSILLVTHSSEQIVNHCNRAILLDNGIQLDVGQPRNIINRYMDILFGKEKKEIQNTVDEVKVEKKSSIAREEDYQLSTQDDIFSTRPGYNSHEYRWGDGSVSILDFYISADTLPYPSVVTTGQEILLAISVQFKTELINPILGITIKTKEGVTVYGVNSETLECNDFVALGHKSTNIEATAKFKCNLAPGDYFISLGIATRSGGEVIPHDRRYDAIHLQVRPDSRFFGLVDLGLKMNVETV